MLIKISYFLFFLFKVFTFQIIFFSNTYAKSSSLNHFIEQSRLQTSDVVIIKQKGRVLYKKISKNEEYLFPVHSITKSVVAIAVMKLIEEGKINDLDVPLYYWFPSWESDPVKKNITLRMVLNHTTGIRDGEDLFNQPDVIRYSMNSPLVSMPGTVFEYNNTATSLLERIITLSAQLEAEKYIENKIFKPLEIKKWKWDKDDHGQIMTTGGLHLMAEDLVKIGEVMLYEGSFRDKRLLSASSVQNMIRESFELSRYGLLWWTQSLSQFYAFGFGGQYIVIDKDKKIVAVRLKEPDEDSSFSDFPDLIFNF